MFTVAGMRDADRRIASYYARAGAADAYRGKFYEGAHRFDVEMQDDAFAWLQDRLGTGQGRQNPAMSVSCDLPMEIHAT